MRALIPIIIINFNSSIFCFNFNTLHHDNHFCVKPLHDLFLGRFCDAAPHLLVSISC